MVYCGEGNKKQLNLDLKISFQLTNQQYRTIQKVFYYFEVTNYLCRSYSLSSINPIIVAVAICLVQFLEAVGLISVKSWNAYFRFFSFSF